MHRTRFDLAANERGFMLVGVVMFMLALTILGLSLFALSSYEAQFYTGSASREQSMQDAESGMELVKALLQLSPQRLENAQLAVGQRGISRAVAYQWRSALGTDTTSRGLVNWDSTLVVEVTAGLRGAERTIQARFIPVPAENPYKKVLTAGGGITYNNMNSTTPQCFEVRGGVWQFVDSGTDTAWTQRVSWPEGRPVHTTAAATPLGNTFVGSKLFAAVQPTNWSGNHAPYTLTLNNSGGGAKFFRGPPSPTDAQGDEDERPTEYDQYSFYVDRDLKVKIRGTVVWLVPRGACFRRNVLVELLDPDVPSTLVIVARPNERDPGYTNRGLWFQGGLTVTEDNACVYLVSEGDIGLTRHQNKSESFDADQVSIVAGGIIELGGPRPGDSQHIEYEPFVMDALADKLISDGALPPLTAATTMSFVLARSTWAETTPR